MAFWLLKSEPDTFGLDDLERMGTSPWDGVRNYQARNHIKAMKKGDGVLFYHSRSEPPGVAGLARVCSKPYPDPTQFDSTSKYYDPGSKPDEPRWWLVDVEFVERFPRLVTLHELKARKGLQDMVVTRKGNRLSVSPVSAAEWRIVKKMAQS
jgi:predicted RNA-binding protein with PUA-like domain